MKKRALSLMLVVCMIVSLFAGLSVSVGADAAAGQAKDECEFSRVFKAKIFVAKNAAAGLEGNVTAVFSTLGTTATLYLPGSADTDGLYLSWSDDALTVSQGNTVYENGTAPIAADGESVSYNVAKGAAKMTVRFKTVKGSEDVAAMFLDLDESMGTIEAMNADETHETSCYGTVSFDGSFYPYMSMKGRGNTTWSLEKKPYNLTFYKKADYDKKAKVSLINGVEAKKWSLLANYMDTSMLRNKIGLALADKLGIGLGTRYVDLWMNGEYLGNYLMTPKNDYLAPDGGYIIEHDNYFDSEDPQFRLDGLEDFLPIDGYRSIMTVKDIGDDAADAGEDESTIEAYMTEAWAALRDYDSEDYQKYFDMDSWAKLYLMYEVTKTIDCFSGSVLMHRDGLTSEDKLIAGPAWDMDNAFGRTLFKPLVGITLENSLSAEGWYVDSIGLAADTSPICLLQEFGKHASFVQRMAEIYNEYTWAFEEIADDIDEQSAIIAQSAKMDIDFWGLHRLNTYMVPVPISFGSEQYRVSYETTASWEAFVSNLREYVAQRVAWLSDHLYAEAPVGSITGETSVETGCPVVLTAELSAGNTDNSYRWQSSNNGKSWSDIEGADGSTLTLTASAETDGMQFRCVVANSGVKICTHHGGKVAASAQTVLAPVTVSVCEHQHSYVDGFCACGAKDPDASFEMRPEKCGLQSGKLILMMNDKQAGEYLFTQVRGNWTIRCGNGKYLAADGTKLVYSDEAAVWSFDNGVFSTNTKLSYTILGKWLGITHTGKVYLGMSGSELTLSAIKGGTASFMTLREYITK